MVVEFTKMHGLGNDLVVIDGISQDVSLSSDRIQSLSDRHFGIGFDQLLLVEPPSEPGVDFDYRIYNADGTEVEHCGNGTRCFANFVHAKGLTRKNPIKVKTSNRILSLHRHDDLTVSVDMGAPELVPESIPFHADHQATVYSRCLEISGEEVRVDFSALSMGNPHAVLIVEDLAMSAVKDIGEALGNHPDFPAGVNVGFMQIHTRDAVGLRVYERGVGETLACGTGACAAVVAGRLQGVLDARVTVELPGGLLTVSWQQDSSSVVMTGPTATVFEGIFHL